MCPFTILLCVLIFKFNSQRLKIDLYNEFRVGDIYMKGNGPEPVHHHSSDRRNANWM
jgi:hypothetical protein